MKEPPEITSSNIRAVLKYIPYLQEANDNFVEYHGCHKGIISMPHVSYSEEIDDLIRDLYENGFVYPFDWGSWQEEAVRLYENPDCLLESDIKTLQKLLTVHVRKERFCEGHLADIVENGHLLAILKRLEVLAGEMGEGEK